MKPKKLTRSVDRLSAEVAQLRADLAEQRKMTAARELMWQEMCDRATRAEAERDEARGRAEKLEWLREVESLVNSVRSPFAWLAYGPQMQELTTMYAAALAECGEG